MPVLRSSQVGSISGLRGQNQAQGWFSGNGIFPRAGGWSPSVSLKGGRTKNFFFTHITLSPLLRDLSLAKILSTSHL